MLNFTTQALTKSQKEFEKIKLEVIVYENYEHLEDTIRSLTDAVWKKISPNIKSFLHSQQTKLLTALYEDLEGKIEETKYGMETFYGDTSHPHPSVVYGKNEALSDIISEIKKII